MWRTLWALSYWSLLPLSRGEILREMGAMYRQCHSMVGGTALTKAQDALVIRRVC